MNSDPARILRLSPRGAALVIFAAAALLVAWQQWSARSSDAPTLRATRMTLPAQPTPAAPAASASTADVAPHQADSAQMAAMLTQLAARLERQPDDPDGWAMLARSYAVTQQHDKAVPAFRKAAALRPADAVLLADFADSLAMSQQRRLSGEPIELVRRALKIAPDNVKALSLAGTEAFDRQDYRTALTHWLHLEKVAPADSPFIVQIRGGIEEARRGAAAQASAPEGTAGRATTTRR